MSPYIIMLECEKLQLVDSKLKNTIDNSALQVREELWPNATVKWDEQYYGEVKSTTNSTKTIVLFTFRCLLLLLSVKF